MKKSLMKKSYLSIISNGVIVVLIFLYAHIFKWFLDTYIHTYIYIYEYVYYIYNTYIYKIYIKIEAIKTIKKICPFEKCVFITYLCVMCVCVCVCVCVFMHASNCVFV